MENPRSWLLCTVLVSASLIFTTADADDVSQAHTPLFTDGSQIWQQGAEGTRVLGDVNAYCLDCHPDEEFTSSSSGIPTMRNHPIGGVYPSGRSDYRTVAMLDQQILLVNRRLTCLSCHDTNAIDHRVLALSSNSGLCAGCHVV